MINKENIQQEIDKTLESLDGLQRAVSNPFLFTRIKARMQKQSGWERITTYLNRPVIALAVLALVIAINGWAVFGSEKENSTQETDSIAIADIPDDYNLTANNNYDYENIPNE